MEEQTFDDVYSGAYVNVKMVSTKQLPFEAGLFEAAIIFRVNCVRRLKVVCRSFRVFFSVYGTIHVCAPINQFSTL